MDGVGIDDELGWHVGLPQRVGITSGIIAERVQSGRNDQRGRQVAVVACEQRADSRVVVADAGRQALWQVAAAVPVELRPSQHRRFGQIRDRRGRQGQVGSRVDQDLPGELRPGRVGTTPVPPLQRHQGGEVAASALAHHRHAIPVGAQLGTTFYQPLSRGPAVEERHGRWMLRCQPVLNRGHHGMGPGRDIATQPVGRPEVADDESTTVEVDDQRSGLRTALRRTSDRSEPAEPRRPSEYESR